MDPAPNGLLNVSADYRYKFCRMNRYNTQIIGESACPGDKFESSGQIKGYKRCPKSISTCCNLKGYV